MWASSLAGINLSMPRVMGAGYVFHTFQTPIFDTDFEAQDPITDCHVLPDKIPLTLDAYNIIFYA